MINGAIARIMLRYGVGLTVGIKVGEELSADTDLVLVLSGIVACSIEGAYVIAKRKGWTT